MVIQTWKRAISRSSPRCRCPGWAAPLRTPSGPSGWGSGFQTFPLNRFLRSARPPPSCPRWGPPARGKWRHSVTNELCAHSDFEFLTTMRHPVTATGERRALDYVCFKKWHVFFFFPPQVPISKIEFTRSLFSLWSLRLRAVWRKSISGPSAYSDILSCCNQKHENFLFYFFRKRIKKYNKT